MSLGWTFCGTQCYLDLVPRLVSPVVIPRAVATEISTGQAEDPAVRFLTRNSWFSVVDLAPALSPLAIWRLGQGESEVLEYARRNSSTIAVLDDKAARRAARALHIPLTGTLGLIVAAAQMKLLPSLSPWLLMRFERVGSTWIPQSFRASLPGINRCA